jgi:pimeloyl-ACP methyl ester carboxylesterase
VREGVVHDRDSPYTPLVALLAIAPLSDCRAKAQPSAVSTALRQPAFAETAQVVGAREEIRDGMKGAIVGGKAFSLFKSEKGEREYLEAYEKALASWPVPYEEADVVSGFGSTHVIVSGAKNARPLVLLHGMHASSTMWAPNIKDFAAEYRVYAIDSIIEPGKSVPSGRIKSRKELADWLVGIFDHFHLEKPPIAGLSRGAWLAINLALFHRDRVGKLALLSPAAAFAFPGSAFTKSVLRLMLFPTKRFIEKIQRSVFFDPRKLDEAFADQHIKAVKHFNMKAGIGVTPTLFTDDELRSLGMPVLLLIGDHDVVNDGRSVERAERLVPDLTARVIPEAGHTLTMDQPELTDGIILEFLSR